MLEETGFNSSSGLGIAETSPPYSVLEITPLGTSGYQLRLVVPNLGLAPGTVLGSTPRFIRP